MIDRLINFRPLALTIVITIHFYQWYTWHYCAFEDFLIRLYNKCFWNSLRISFCCHEDNVGFGSVRAIYFLLPHIVVFLYGLFALSIGMCNYFGFLKSFFCRIFTSHKSQIATLHQFQLSCICCHIIRTFTVHFYNDKSY